METLTEALNRLREEGYRSDFAAVGDGELRCVDCGAFHDPGSMTIDHVVRFEGESNPDDAAILLAMRCSCGIGGIYTSAYGSGATSADVGVLTRLPRSA